MLHLLGIDHIQSSIADQIHPQPVSARSVAVPLGRGYSTASEPDLKTTFKEIIPEKRELLKKVKALGDKVIGEVKVENTIGGMRYVLT